MSTDWFGRKRIGWGIRPASWEGWTTVLICIAVGVAAYFYFWTMGEKLTFAILLTVDVAVFGGICWAKFDRKERS